jgi:fluoroquinolone transport system ATP-binding protein
MIRVENLCYTYPGAHTPALRGLEFSVEPGQIFGFLGPSGAGKSTTQSILIGLLRGYQGRVTIFGREMATWGRAYYERIGVSFELPNHFLRLTAIENLRAFAALYRGPTRDPRELLERLGLQGDGDTPVGQFSKGMKARLNLARALLHDPELLFLDEPTSGLDPATALLVRDLIRAERDAGRTIFLTTHAMAVADELCDRVAFLVDGTIRLTGAPRELKLRFGQPLVRVETGGDRHAAHDFPLTELGANEAFLRLLREESVQTIHTREASLDEIFVHVTGRALA